MFIKLRLVYWFSSFFLLIGLFLSGSGNAAVAVPEITISDGNELEGDSGAAVMTFAISMDTVSTVDVTVDYDTADDGSANAATAGGDYTSNSSTLTIAAGSTTANITVSINGDTDIESDETFSLVLSNAVNATLATTMAIGTILNDELAAVPVASLSMQPPKGIQLSWHTTAGADYYQVLKNPDGVSGFSVIASALTELEYTETVAVHLHDWLNASYLVEACNSIGCVQSYSQTTMDLSATAIGYFKASNTDSGDVFGISVALSDDGLTLAIAAPGEDSNTTDINGDQSDNSALDSGAVYVYRYDGSLWAREAYIKASNAEAGDDFGISIALDSDGNTLVVGATGESSNAIGINNNSADNSELSAGALFVFRFDGTEWLEEAYIKASNTESLDNFGVTVALSDDGNTLVTGASLEDSNASTINGNQANNSASASGAVYVFNYDGSNWEQDAYIKANSNSGDKFGSALALSANGKLLAVGAYAEDSNAIGVGNNASNNGASNSGAVYIFERVGGSWSRQSYIKATNTNPSDWFGYSLALSDNGLVLAVGAIGEASYDTGVAGNQSDNSTSFAGAVYIYWFDGSDWQTGAYLKASNTNAIDIFGDPLALNASGDVLVVGALNESSLAVGINGNEFDNSSPSAGAAYVFTRDGSVWSQQSYIKAPNTDNYDFFGHGMSISADGNTLAIGGYNEASAVIGINQDQLDNSSSSSGAVYVY